MTRTVTRKPFCIAMLSPAAAAMFLLAPAFSSAAEPSALFEDVHEDEVLQALYRECYEAGMITEPMGDQLVCSVVLTGHDELDGAAIVSAHEGRIRHRIRFALADRAGGVRVWAYPWVEIEEPGGNLLEQGIASEEYLNRVQAVLNDTAESLGDDARPDTRPWAEHYASPDEWRLDAHLRAVAYCDEGLADLTPEELERRLDLAAFQPVGKGLRDRCEELYEEIFRWGLARGLHEPTVHDYAAYRAELPPGERVCSGRLALESTCR